MAVASIPGNRWAGDDWTWIWTNDTDVSDYDIDTFEVTIRESYTQDSTLVATNVGDDATLIVTGSDDLNVPATNFTSDGGTIGIYMVSADTLPLDPNTIADTTLYMGIKCKVNGRLTTLLPASPFLVYTRISS